MMGVVETPNFFWSRPTMLARSPFKELAHSRFCKAFGKPIAVAGMDDEWSFEPRSKSACVKIVLHEKPLEATLWVQETEKGRSQSAYNAAIKSPGDVDA